MESRNGKKLKKLTGKKSIEGGFYTHSFSELKFKPSDSVKWHIRHIPYLTKKETNENGKEA